MKQKLFTLLLAVAASVGTMFASDTQVDGIWYDFDNSTKTASVTYRGNSYYTNLDRYSGNVVIPSSVIYNAETYSVTSIGDYAFYGCSGLTSVTIPNSVTSIGGGAFPLCSSLTSVTIPNSVTSIGGWAFAGCRGLTSPVYNAHVFAYMPTSYSGEYTIPDGIESIAGSAFDDCTGLTSVTIPNSVTSIGDRAFRNCTGLTSPVYNAHVFAFMPTSYSGAYTIPDGIESIAGSAFYDCKGLTSLIIPNNVTSIGDYAFYGCSSLTSITIPNSVTSIGDEAFLYCSGLTSIYATCGDLERVKQLFNNDSRVKYAPLKYSITYNVNIREAGSVQIPENECGDVITAIPNIGYRFVKWADGNTDNPRTIVLTQDTTMEAIFDYLLTGSCGQNNALTWTLDTTSLSLNISGSGALSENYTYGTFIKSLTIEDAIAQIGKSAFANFANLKNVILGKGVKVLEQKAFYNCSAIDTIFCYSQRPPTVNTNALYGLPYSTVVLVPAAYLNNYMMHDVWGLYDVQPMGLALQLSVNIPELGVVSGAGTYAEGTIATISATPNYGYHFVQWNDGNTDNPRTITLTQDTAFVANFAPNRYSISVNYDKEQGIVEGETGQFDYKTQHTYTVIPNYGYHFTQWADGNTANPRTITLTQDTILTASFSKNSYTITLQSANPEQGAVAGSGTFEYLEQKQISATGNYGYHFDKWSDGNKDNPRTITLTQDTILTAYFAVDKSGTCGKDNLLQWSFTEDGTLTISGKGALTANYTFGVEAPTQMKTLIIGNEVTAIGERAFYNRSTINHLVIGGSVISIGDYAFAECRNFDDITCYAQDVPTINSTTFENVGNKQYIYLYVPEDRERAYKRDVYWGEFDVQVKGASTTTTDDKVVTVEPSDNSASITWPTENNAASYTLQITKDGVVFCTLVFNSNGQLIGIAFAPSHDEAPHAPAATMSVAGMTFTVTGLNTASKYAYRLAVADEDDNEIQAYSGEFATTGYQGEVNPGGQPENPISTALDQTIVDQTPTVTKFIRDGQLFIQRDGKTYSVTGQEVK